MRIYQIGGTLEGAGFIEDMFEMHHTLQEAGFDEEELYSVESPDGTHGEWFWAREFADAYLWLFRADTTETNFIRPSWLSTIELYPNPTSEALNLDFDLTQDQEVTIELIMISGQKSQRIHQENLLAGKHNLNFDLKKYALSDGHYLLQITTTEGKAVWPFVVKK